LLPAGVFPRTTDDITTKIYGFRTKVQE